MFEAVEVGRRVKKSEFDQREPEIRTKLLQLQRELRGRKIPTLIIISGVETAGKGDVVRKLTHWFDPRGVRTQASWHAGDVGGSRPFFWRFWRRLPARGDITVMFGSWYSNPIVEHAHQRLDDIGFDHRMAQIAQLERMLSIDGMVIVKLWFHLKAKEQARRIKKELERGTNPNVLRQKKFAKRYDDFVRSAERAIRLTDSGRCPWHLVEATDKRYRYLSVAEILISELGRRVAREPQPVTVGESQDPTPLSLASSRTTILDRVDLGQKLSRTKYRSELKKIQREIQDLAWKMHGRNRLMVALFEGWDAAGKGGTIRRLVAPIDPRLYRIISVAAPTDEELAHHYLWRFWRHIPAVGNITIYDRSWYGRVLVERVEEFTPPDQWQRAYREINAFEEQLVEHGIILLKFWIHISKDEQLRRFKEREEIPWKKHKITDEDWRNRERWELYEAAVNEMVARTSTDYAPWTLIAGNDKLFGRVSTLKTVRDAACAALEADEGMKKTDA